jgi:hypothetical protein
MAWEEKASLVTNQGSNYTWSQTISDVTINIPLPEGTSAKQIECVIKTTTIKVGIRGQNHPFLEGELCASVKPSDCTWTIEDKKLLVIQLEKSKAHDSWISIVKGKDEVDAVTKESMDKKMLLEKFQRDYPGFDFSGAEMTGQMPENPATYLHPSTFDQPKQ